MRCDTQYFGQWQSVGKHLQHKYIDYGSSRIRNQLCCLYHCMNFVSHIDLKLNAYLGPSVLRNPMSKYTLQSGQSGRTSFGDFTIFTGKVFSTSPSFKTSIISPLIGGCNNCNSIIRVRYKLDLSAISVNLSQHSSTSIYWTYRALGCFINQFSSNHCTLALQSKNLCILLKEIMSFCSGYFF